IGPSAQITIRTKDVTLTGRPTDELTRDDARLPFDFERGRLLRALLVRERDVRHVLALTIHHIAFDGWSIDVLFRDLFEAYQSGDGQEPQWPELPVQYADFAVWQRQWLDDGRLE